MANENQNEALSKHHSQHEVYTFANENDQPPTMVGYHRAGAGGEDGDFDHRELGGSFVPRRCTNSELKEIQNISKLQAWATQHALAPSMGAFVNYGAEDEESIRANRRGFDRYSLRPRVLRDVSRVETSTTILRGRVRLGFPVCVAPFAGCRALHPDGEVAVASAAAQAETIYTIPNWASVPLPDILDSSSRCHQNSSTNQNLQLLPPLFFQLYPHKPANAKEGIHRGHMEALLKYLALAAADRVVAVVVTCDTINNGNREKTYKNPQWLADVIEEVGGFPKPCALQGADLPPVPEEGHPASMTWKDISWMKEECQKNRLALILKGIMTWEDAVLSAKTGVDAIIVSNHGGRQLDGTRGTVEVVEECVKALARIDSAMEVYVDGGVRRGKDVARCLSLGAKCVFVGRPILWGLAAGGQAGVAKALHILRDEFREVLQLMGCQTPQELSRANVAKDDDPPAGNSETATTANQDPAKWIIAMIGVAVASFSLGRSFSARRV